MSFKLSNLKIKKFIRKILTRWKKSNNYTTKTIPKDNYWANVKIL